MRLCCFINSIAGLLAHTKQSNVFHNLYHSAEPGTETLLVLQIVEDFGSIVAPKLCI
jgi:hypothetical protein